MILPSSNTPQTLILLNKLRENSHLGKHKHFAAADRYRYYNTYVGAPAIIINIVLGSVFVANLSEQISTPLKWIGAFLALVAAMLSGLQTFFNLQKSFESHRKVANRYLGVARECERLICLFEDDQIKLSDLAEKIEEMNKCYNDVNSDAEEFPTNSSDYRKAQEIQRKKGGDSNKRFSRK
jgi:hypothetical protein